ncbi:hypothetical protein [Streptomyces sp. NPDC015131]|uniref:hypothetical protein n=1 Tax=Streptomyces sp. NPDC015131 TaxID=3364941 RepID=UPI0036F58A4E
MMPLFGRRKAQRKAIDQKILAGEHVHAVHPEGDEHCEGGESADSCGQWNLQLEEWRETL